MKINDFINGKTKLLALIGNPVEHSKSPLIHNTLSSHLNLNLAYLPFCVESNNLLNAINGFLAINIIGFNVTVPYKQDIMKYLDEITDEAKLMGAVNTVKNIDGRLVGYNTDAYGFVRAFCEELSATFKNKKVLIIGAGGASNAICVQLAIEGISKLYVLNRTLSKAREICSNVNNMKDNDVSVAIGFDNKELDTICSECDIVVNTTSIGMFPDIDKSPIPKEFIKEHHVVYDIIYNPNVTKLMKDAQSKGCKVLNGLGMLFYQAISAYEIWTSKKLETETILKLIDNIKKSNIM